jgi:LacI family transcriptional regulator
VDVAAVAHVPLTSVRMPKSELGQAAVDLLLAEMQEGPAHRHRSVVFKPELVVRASTDPRASG